MRSWSFAAVLEFEEETGPVGVALAMPQDVASDLLNRVLPRWALGGKGASHPPGAPTSRYPGSSKRWVAPGTTASWVSQRSRARARRLSSRTTWSRPPTMSNVGAFTRASLGPARSGRPPRETMAAIDDPG